MKTLFLIIIVISIFSSEFLFCTENFRIVKREIIGNHIISIYQELNSKTPKILNPKYIPKNQVYTKLNGKKMYSYDYGNNWDENQINDDLQDSQNNYRMFPNPASNFIVVRTPEDLESMDFSRIKIFNTLGVEIIDPALSINGDEVRIDVSHLPAGVYFIKIDNSVERLIKFIKQ